MYVNYNIWIFAVGLMTPHHRGLGLDLESSSKLLTARLVPAKFYWKLFVEIHNCQCVIWCQCSRTVVVFLCSRCCVL